MRILFGVLLLHLFSSAAFAQSDGAPTFKMDGQAALMSNFMEYGLTQTDSDPALQGQFWFNWGPQFRLGIFGSNVNYENSTSHLLLRINAELRVIFSNNADMVLRYSNQNYFKPEERNGTVSGIQITMFGYGIRYENLSNMQGTDESATVYGFSKTWDVMTDWKWENTIGYGVVNDKDFDSFFWGETALGRKPANIYYQIGAGYNSSPSQFQSSGSGVFVKASVSF